MIKSEVKETLIVEYLPAYKRYRIWNSWFEDWVDTWEEVVKIVSNSSIKKRFNFISYNNETMKKLEEELK